MEPVGNVSLHFQSYNYNAYFLVIFKQWSTDTARREQSSTVRTYTAQPSRHSCPYGTIKGLENIIQYQLQTAMSYLPPPSGFVALSMPSTYIPAFAPMRWQ